MPKETVPYQKLSGEKRKSDASAYVPPAKEPAPGEIQATSTTQELLQRLQTTETQVNQLTSITTALTAQAQTAQLQLDQLTSTIATLTSKLRVA